MTSLPPGPSVSVILPVWNGQRFLVEAIESILDQTHKSFELLVVDDGSTDRSAAIASGYARQDPRILIISLPHSGIVRALNAAIAAARGRYLARMDADDCSLPSRLHRQVAFLEAHPSCVAVGCALEVIDEDGATIGAVRYPEQHRRIAEALLNAKSPMAHPTVVMCRDAVIAAGGYREETFPSEDFDLWLRLNDVGELANIPEVLVRYRRHPDTVRVREHGRHRTTAAAIVHAARLKRGMPPLTFRSLRLGAAPSAAVYHFECTGIALKAGMRGPAFRHARATISAAPFWPPPYAALAACALPKRSLQLLAKMYSRFRAIDH